MRKAVVTVTAIAGLAVLVAAASAAGNKVVRIHFTSKVTGAGITATRSVFEVRDSHFGTGAGTQTVKLDKSGTSGSDREKTYYGNGTATSKGTFKVGTPDANGVAPLTGSGHDVSGTGRAKGLRSSYTYSGTINVKTGVFKVTLKGVYKL